MSQSLLTTNKQRGIFSEVVNPENSIALNVLLPSKG